MLGFIGAIWLQFCCSENSKSSGVHHREGSTPTALVILKNLRRTHLKYTRTYSPPGGGNGAQLIQIVGRKNIYFSFHQEAEVHWIGHPWVLDITAHSFIQNLSSDLGDHGANLLARPYFGRVQTIVLRHSVKSG
jgi:hypothetical protein